MDFIELSQSDRQSYNDFVIKQSDGNFLQSWEWGEWQEKLGKQVYRFKLEDDKQNTIAAAQLIKMPLPFGKYYLYSPYGPVGNYNLQFISQEIQKKFPDAMFIRIEPRMVPTDLTQIAKKSINIQPAITIIVDTNKTDEELLAAMHPKTRYNIKVAQKHGVEIQAELVVTPQHGLYMKEAVDLIIETQGRQKYRGHSKKYYEDLINFFAIRNVKSDLKVRIYKALYQKKLLTSAIMIDFGKTRTYLYGGSSDESRNVMAPYLLHWQAIQDARDLGLAEYDLGGSEVSAGGERGFTRFKQGFGGRVVNFAGAYDVIFKKSAYNIYQVVRKINRLLVR